MKGKRVGGFMSGSSQITSKLTRTFYTALRSDRFSSPARVEQHKKVRRSIVRQAVCIETAVTVTLVVYIGWVCISGWYFERPIVTHEHMLMGSFLALVAALSAKLLWMAWSKIIRG